MEIGLDSVQAYRPCRVFTSQDCLSVAGRAKGYTDRHSAIYGGRTCSMDFYPNEFKAVLLDGSGRLKLFNVETGVKEKETNDSINRPTIVRFANHPTTVLYSTSDANPTERHYVHHHSMYSNTVLNKFTGHRARITSISVEPNSDMFVTSDIVGNVCFWDLRTMKSQMALNLKIDEKFKPRHGLSRTFSCIAPGETILALSATENEKPIVGTLDVRKPDRLVAKAELPCDDLIQDLSYSPNGKHLIATTEERITRLDPDLLETKQVIYGSGETTVPNLNYGKGTKTSNKDDFRNIYPLRQSCFDPTSNFILTPTADKTRLAFYRVRDGATDYFPDCHSTTRHPSPIDILGWFPGSELIISTCKDSVAFWNSVAENKKAGSQQTTTSSAQ